MDDFNPAHKTKNLTSSIPFLVQWLSTADDGDDYLDTYIYDHITNFLYPGMPDVSKSYALRLLIHLVGDLHQPLHNLDKYDADNLKGDNGGNSFDLPYRMIQINTLPLHS